jgi:GNAT superfamily N-acetyltransferase
VSIIVRRAAPDDAAEMSRVLVASISKLCAADHGNKHEAIAAWTANKTVSGITAMLANPDLLMFVAGRGNRVEAVGAINRSGMVILNYVAPEARFCGLSKALLARLEAELLALGFSEAQLEATATARPFYERAGWVADGPQAEGRAVNGYPMRKRLAA